MPVIDPNKKRKAKKIRLDKPTMLRSHAVSKEFSSSDKVYRFAGTAGANDLRTFNQPTYTDQELEFFEEAWSTTPAGTALDKRMEFVIGGGVKPTFELINPTKEDGSEFTETEKADILSTYQDQLNELIEIDSLLNFNQMLFDASVQAKVFGRSVIVFENQEEDKSTGIPKSLKLIHSRNLNRVEINQADWTIDSVKSSIPGKIIDKEEMIYLVNKPNSPIRHTLWYGYSEMQRIVGAARAFRRIVEFDMPEIATSLWAPAWIIFLKKLGRTDSDATTDANNILNNIKAGAMSAIEIDALDEIELQTLDLKGNIKDLVEVANMYKTQLVGNSQTPSALLGDESEPNRATLIGKMRFFLEGPVKSDREWLSNQLGMQWYERNLKKLGHKEILEHVKIKVEFEPIFIESWDDIVESAGKLKAILPGLPIEVLLNILNLEEFKDEIITNMDDAQEEIKGELKEEKEIAEARTKDTNDYFKQAMAYMQKVAK